MKHVKSKSIRHLKITSKHRSRKTLHSCIVPELRLCGDWLTAAGFAAGGQVEIKVEENQLIIKTAKS